jgi:hypothetical protein
MYDLSMGSGWIRGEAVMLRETCVRETIKTNEGRGPSKTLRQSRKKRASKRNRRDQLECFLVTKDSARNDNDAGFNRCAVDTAKLTGRARGEAEDQTLERARQLGVLA